MKSVYVTLSKVVMKLAIQRLNLKWLKNKKMDNVLLIKGKVDDFGTYFTCLPRS